MDLGIQLLAFIHFSDNVNITDTVQHVIVYFSKKFQENIKLVLNISIDGCMIPWPFRISKFIILKNSHSKLPLSDCIQCYHGIYFEV